MSNTNNGNNDLRLIEDYLPIEAISAEASREKSVRKGHISTLHLWWARRPLVACRAAVYGALVPADRWVKDLDVKNPPADGAKAAAFKSGAKRGLNRKAAKEFVTKLCRYPKTDPTKPADIKLKRDTEAAIVEAQKHILEAHADRLTAELAEAKKTGQSPAWVDEFKFKGDKVAYADIIAGRAPRPRVLDMFAGGGAIPLEALRLGCEAYALDLNPVAHIIQLCTLVYPQKYGKPDPTARGMTGPKNAKGETTWGGLASEVRYWGNWVLDRVRKDIGELYPPIPDPNVWDTPPEIAFDRKIGQWKITKPGKPKRGVKVESSVVSSAKNPKMFADRESDEAEDDSDPVGAGIITLLPGFLQPVVYLWTRTVRCKNPRCLATVPLSKLQWIRRERDDVTGHYVGVVREPNTKTKSVSFQPVSGDERDEVEPTEPAARAGNVVCPFCGTANDDAHVKQQGCEGRIGVQLMVVGTKGPGRHQRVYIGDADLPPEFFTLDSKVKTARERLCRNGLTAPDEKVVRDGKQSVWIDLYGLTDFGKVYTNRQTVVGLAFSSAVRAVAAQIMTDTSQRDHAVATCSMLAMALDRHMNQNNTLTIFNAQGETIEGAVNDKTLPMAWDFPEPNPLANITGSIQNAIGWVVAAATELVSTGPVSAMVTRGSATEAVPDSPLLDAVITDPPYYDNVSYAVLSDFFFSWLKRSVGDMYPAHFAGSGAPKKQEAVMDSERHGGDSEAAKSAYQQMMQNAFLRANERLKPGAPLCCVYAHKTTLGWATLVDGLRSSGFEITEAWPLETERKGGRKGDKAMLASSIFLVGRKRAHSAGIGNYEENVQPELQQIVRERVETLWDMGIAGADLVIACVGAGLRAFTRYEKVEYANGEEVPAEKFLAEVEGVVLDTMMGKLFGQSGATVSAIDPASRFYVLWRFIYKASEIEAGEAIVFTYAQHVELDGPQGLSAGKDALVEKKKANYRVRDYTERGDNEKLGLPNDTGQASPLIDALHRILWLMENSPRKLNAFLDEARPDRERLRVLAQALAGAALSGKSEEESAKLVSTTAAEQAALGKLLANWRSLIEARLAADEGGLFGKKS